MGMNKESVSVTILGQVGQVFMNEAIMTKQKHIYTYIKAVCYFFLSITLF